MEYKSLVPVRPLALLLAAWPLFPMAQDTQLGEVKVVSITIDDRFASRRAEPSTTHDISGKTVDEKRPENMIQILNAIPGVTVDLSSGDDFKIKLRGIENQCDIGEKPGEGVTEVAGWPCSPSGQAALRAPGRTRLPSCHRRR